MVDPFHDELVIYRWWFQLFFIFTEQNLVRRLGEPIVMNFSHVFLKFWRFNKHHYALDLPPTQKQWQMKVSKDSLLKV